MSTAIILFVFGLVVGSFLNVVSFRYDSEGGVFDLKNLSGRSHCPSCGTTLQWYELIPVISFLIQRAKCRTCGVKISWQYPLVELASGFTFLLPFYFQQSMVNGQLSIVQSILWIAVFLIFILIWTIDYRLYLIPDGLNLSLAGLGIIATALSAPMFGEFSGSFMGSYAGLFGLRSNAWLNHGAAVLFGIALVAAIIIVSRGKGMGMGDLKLMGALGLLFGWPDILFVFMFGSIIGAVVSIALMAQGKKGMKSHVPFGPFLILGALTVFFFGEALLGVYFNLFLL